MRIAWWIGAGLLAAAPVGADVRAGVEAWGRGDYRRAVEEWRGPAIAGDADAQFNLGQAHKLGRGVRADQGLAEKWFRMAAAQGHEQAIANYALTLFQAERRADALPWLEKAAARGEPRCQLVLGTMLFNGDGTARDYARAYALVSRAMTAGLPTAADTLARMDQYLTPADRTKGAALAQQYAAISAAPAGRDPSAVRTIAAASPVPQQPRPMATLAPRPRPTPTAAPLILEAAPGASDPIPMRVGSGGWGVQLGAFRERRNAEAMWAQMASRFPDADPAYLEKGGLIRVKASGYATKVAAEAACRRAGMPACILIAPQ
jgi:cell division septation protein DedD